MTEATLIHNPNTGFDAHTLNTIGRGWVEAPDQLIEGPQDLPEALRQGVPRGTWTDPLLYQIRLIWNSLRRMLLSARRQLLPDGGR